MKKIHFDIQGMTCASCQAHVRKAVQNLDGTTNVNVNLLANDMTVDIDENKIKKEDIIKAVENAGYKAIFTDNDGQESVNQDSKNVQKNKSRFMKNKVQESNEKIIKNMKSRLIISVVFWIPLMYLAMHHMLYEWFRIPVPQFIIKNFHGTENALSFVIVQFLLLIPIIWTNRSYFKNGFKSLIRFSPNMDSLIALGAFASTAYGIAAIFGIGIGNQQNNIELVEKFSKNIYFESAGTILTLITVGKFLEAKSKGKTGNAISKLINLAPKTAIVIRNGQEQKIPSEDIELNDILLIKPGSSIPVDGIIVEGSSTINQSSITGESIPVEKNVSDEVISGTINQNGTLKMKATKVGDETTLSQIVKLVEEASTSKAPIENIADKVSAWFVPIIILICIITFLVWIFNGKYIGFALEMAVSVLVISCPCALGLATPVAIMVGTGKGAENGILIKSAESLQKMNDVKVVVFDKTGTVTEGKPIVTDIVSELNESEFLSIAGSLEKMSEHPLAEAIVKKAEQLNVQIKEVKDFEAVVGKGICAQIGENKFWAGNKKFIKESVLDNNNYDKFAYEKKADELSSKGKTVLYFANEKELIGIIAVSDIIKPTSKMAVDVLKHKGIKSVMITGDNKSVAEEIAKQVGIEEVYSEVLPQEKEKIVEKIKLELKKHNKNNMIAFVGDGVNDSPALANADVGLAIGSGTDIAIESADIILVKNNLLDVVTTIDLSKRTMINIKENLFWAFFYNAICIPIACGFLYNKYGIKLNPMIGSAAMSLSSICVVLNALRLSLFKSKYKDINKGFSNQEISERGGTIMKKEVYIEGMMCGSCANHVKNALEHIDGVNNVEINLQNKKAVIETNKEIEEKALEDAVTKAGYIWNGVKNLNK